MRTATALPLTMGDTCTCPQTISFSVCCKWFRWAVLPLDGTLEAEIFRDKDLKRCSVCGRLSSHAPTGGKYCPDCAARVHRRQEKQKVNGKGGLLWTVRSEKKALIFKALQALNRGRWYKSIAPAPEKRASNRPQNEL